LTCPTLTCRLGKEGLTGEIYCAPAQAYINGTATGQSLDQAVAAVQQERERREGRTARSDRVDQLLAAEGLMAYRYDVFDQWQEYIHNGEGSADDVVAAARAARDAQQEEEQRLQRVQQEEEQRRHRVQELLGAEGISLASFEWRVPGLRTYLRTGDGSEAEVIAAVQEVHQAEQQRQQRRTRMRQLLEAEGLQAFIHSTSAYTESGDGSEEQALEAARQAALEHQQRVERRARITELLQAEGISYNGHTGVPAVFRYVLGIGGSEQEAVEAAHAAQQAAQLEQQRRARLAALLEEEGLGGHGSAVFHTYAAYTYVQNGEGTAEDVVAEARAKRDRQAGQLGKAYAV